MENTKAPLRKDDLRSRFESLLLRLDPDRDHAGEKYEELRRRLIRFFGWNDCFPEEDLADETFDRVALRMKNEDVQDVVRFTWGVARNITREFHKRVPMVDIENLPPRQSPNTGHVELTIINAAERRRRLQCLHQCIQRLPASERELFLAYEYYTDRPQNTEQLAERFRLTVGALQTKAHRIKHKVEMCSRRCFAARRRLSLTFSKADIRDEL